jgi:peptidyl-prolyl cis-trans isomerase B (cyclophilin B)
MTYPPQQPETSGWSSQPGGTPPGRPKTALIVGAVAVTLIVLGGVTAWALWPPTQTQGTALGAPTASTALPSTSAATTLCQYSPTPDQPSAKDVGLPDTPSRAEASGTVQVTLKTNQGDIPMTLDRLKAPCTVQNFLFLAKKKYFDGTPCHRLTINPGFKVLQCGDPIGTGTGGPGYVFADELPKDFTPADAETVVYPTGTVAMANAGPGTNGSQFFLVYSDTKLPPHYSVFGTYNAAGQTTIDKIAANGVNPAPERQNPGDGAPKTPVTIQQAAVEG